MGKPADLLPDDLLAQATCALLIDGKVKGTAWLVSDEGHLLTAGHLLGTDKPCDDVEIRFAEDVPYKAYKIQWGYQQEMGIDFAVLKLPGSPVNRRPLPVSLAQVVKGTFRLHGYGASLKDRSVGAGEFIGPFDPQNSPGNRLFQLRSPELGEGGYSGAAVFSDELRAVVAIQVEATRAATGSGRDTILAMPLYRIAQQWELLTRCGGEEKDKPQAESWRQGRVEHLERQLEIYYRNLNYIEEQIARTYPISPLSLLNQRDQLNEAITTARSELATLGRHFDFAPLAVTPKTKTELPPSLWFYEGEKLVQLIDLEDLDWTKAVYLGRSRNCQIMVGQECIRVSRRHAQLFKIDEAYLLKDNQSSWGTYVNGIEIDHEQGKCLADGDQIVLGGFSIQDRSPARHTCVFVFREG